MTGIMMASGAGGVTAAPFTAATDLSTVSWNYDAEFNFYTSDTITATPTGGTGPYTYAWETVSGDAFTGMATAAVSFISGGGSAAVVRCLVTDNLGASAYTNNVSIS